MIDYSAIRIDQFPSASRQTYLNTASDGLNPRCVLDAMEAYLRTCREYGAGKDFDQRVIEFSVSLRQKMARLIHADTCEVAIASSTSDALSILANGIRFAPGDSVIVADQEFPANVYVWMNLARRGVSVHFVESSDGRVSPDDIAAVFDASTRVVSISGVSMLTGFRADLEAIGDLCERQGAYLVVDAVQQLGVLDLDVSQCRIHMLAAGCYKWLMVPNSVAFLYVRKDVIDQLELSKVGWTNFMNETAFFENPEARYEFRPKADASRFQESYPCAVGMYGLDAALDFIAEIGIEHIERRAIALAGILAHECATLGIPVVSPMDAAGRSAIVVVNPSDPRAAFEQLRVKGVVASLRRNGIRFSPHFYNDERDVLEALDALRESSRG